MTYKGWHSRGYLPHFDSAEVVQFVTFRLADSLPRALVDALSKLPDSLVRIDQQLDGGLGSCWLQQPAIARLVEEALLHFDGDRYRLLAWCIMPNHVHGRRRAGRWAQSPHNRGVVEIVHGQGGESLSVSQRFILAP